MELRQPRGSIFPLTLMETLSIWADAHPSISTVPMEWDYSIPFGAIYPAEPTKSVADFIAFIAELQADLDGNAGKRNHSRHSEPTLDAECFVRHGTKQPTMHGRND